MTLRSGFGKFGVAAGGGGGSLGTGGTIVALNGYNYHVFTSSGTFEVTQVGSGSEEAGALVIAGGGAGGGGMGGGGGAGGVLYSSASFPLAIGPYTVTIGAGGVRSPAYAGLPSAPGRSQSGSNSSLGPHVALGGGGGGSYSHQFPTPGNHGGPGGSGGGVGGQYPPSANANIPTGTQPANNPSPSVWTTYGNPGGRGANGPYQGSGGGGSGGVGNTAFGTSNHVNYGHGGVAQPFAGWPGPGLGLPAIPSVFWAAGGEGNGYPGNSGSGTARNGIGGGAGTNMNDGSKADGVTNSGSGGGGSLYNQNPLFGLGGSGIVIIRYLS